MRSFKKAMLVAALLGGITAAGTGMAQADGHGGHGGPDIAINNAQPQTCNANSLIPIQVPVGLGILGHGAATAIGQSCVQSGPSFGK